MNHKFTGLVIICNCGEQMEDFGEWPVSYPTSEDGRTMNVHQAARYRCKTCRIPNDKYAKGNNVMIAILD